MSGGQQVRRRSLVVAGLAALVAMLALDLTWLGVVARGIYHEAMGPLERPDVVWQAALAFYALYLWAIVRFAALEADFVAHAAWRGAGLGLLAYGTYDLTNLAVIRGYSASLVPIDMAWGVVLTAMVSAIARFVLERSEDRRA